MVSLMNGLRAGGLRLEESVRQGAIDRLRPVLMTALVAALGFVPMAVSTSPGSEVQRPLASVVIGGLVTSTFLTLVVLPSLYLALGRWLQRHRGVDETYVPPELALMPGGATPG
jgi:cobalt-zinc-cadmium resistance protein CzcA